MTTAVAENHHPPKHAEPVQRPRLAKLLRVLAIPIIIFWVLVAVVTNVFLPSLDDVTADNAGPLVARDAPSAQAAIHQGNDFDESNYTSVAVLLLETKDRKLGEQDHQYYNEVVRRLLDDTKHVASVQDLWGKPVTMSGSQSADAEATTLTIRPVGDLGSSEANKSIDAIRDVVAKVPKPDGLSAYITGPAPLAADTLHATDKSLVKLTIVTVILIVILLLIAYRSITIALIPLFGVLTTLAVARGIISFLVGQGVIEISSFASNLLVSLVLGASTDYAIFYLGRYQEARQKGEDKESSYYESVANVPHVILGSGIAISGATLCLSLTHLDYFRTLGPPCAVSMVVAVLSALTLGPALLTLGSKIGWIQPRKKRANPVWRKVGTVIARWPVPMIALAALIIPLCMLGWTTYKVSYNDRDFAPASVEASTGYAAADKHFPKSWLNNDIVYVKSDHDMRNTTDMISLDRVAKAIIRTPGVALVQSVTRPNGRPLEHASLPYAFGSTGTKIGENITFLRDRVADIDTIAAKTASVIDATKRLENLTRQLANGTHISRESAEQLQTLTGEARDHLADFDDFMRPMRNYFHWEPHCYDIPICWAFRSLLDTTDSVNAITDEFGNTVQGLTIIDTVTPQIIDQIDAVVSNLETVQSLTLTLQSTFMHSSTSWTLLFFGDPRKGGIRWSFSYLLASFRSVYGAVDRSRGRGGAPAAQRGRTTSRPARIRRILIGRGTRQRRCGSSHLLPPGTECVRETSLRVPAPSLIWVHGRGSGDMMMDGVPGVRAAKGVRPLSLSGKSTQQRGGDRRPAGAGRRHQLKCGQGTCTTHLSGHPLFFGDRHRQGGIAEFTQRVITAA